MINWITKRDEYWSGTFLSSYFRNSDNNPEMEICIDNACVADYAEKCVFSFNHLTASDISKICKGILDCSGRQNTRWKLNSFLWRRNPVAILDHCYFSSVYVNIPDDKNQISYIVEGEGEWEDVIGFVIHDGHLVYVGTDYLNEHNWS